MYKLHLILKYLRRRFIAWVALAAVVLCTAMVIVVISVMGGWLRMFEKSARGMTGDIVVKGPSLAGFPYYEEMIDEIEKLTGVVAAVPEIHTYGLLNIANRKPTALQVVGLPIDKIGQVNDWPQSLYRQSAAYLDQGKIPPPVKTFDLHTIVKAPLFPLPNAIAVRDRQTGTIGLAGDPLWDKLRYDFEDARLSFTGHMTTEEKDKLIAVSDEKDWQRAIKRLATETNYPGMIAGAGVLEIRKGKDGKIEGRDPFKYELWAKLTVIGIEDSEQQSVDLSSAKAERTYWIVDDSRTGMWQYDNNTVYVPFDVLQRDLGMGSDVATDRLSGEKVKIPARASEINIRVAEGADLALMRSRIEKVVQGVLLKTRGGLGMDDPRVQTWREASALFIGAIEKEKLLVVILFGIISLVAVFLIFCIFFMIVAEKTRDIGIIKSVGATSSGVAGIFLGYGLVIGIVGTGLGLLVSYLIVHNINEIHDWLGRQLGLTIWNPEVYAFESIPNRMDPKEVIVIITIAILASVLGALVPAIRAARLNPVEALRWE